jgi:rRNA-processing protein FCF1
MLLILDEWIIHDLQGDNGKEKQKESFVFLQKIEEKCDKISWILDSKFIHKYNNFCKFCGTIRFDPELRKKIKFINACFLRKLQKVEIIKLDELNIEVEEYNHILQRIKDNDHYLIKAYFYLRQKNIESIIITTDEPLIKTLREHNIPIEHRDDFIREYQNLAITQYIPPML